MLKPINGSVLVELLDELEFIQTPDKPYATKTKGTVVDGGESAGDLVGKTVFFADFKDGTQVEVKGKTYAFIDYEDIKGYDE